jgi:two-component system sensor histidine kinase UhpB
MRPSPSPLRRLVAGQRLLGLLRMRLWLPILLCGLTLGHPGVRAQTLTLDQALMAPGDTPHFPEGTAARPVQLPDQWSDSGADEQQPVWYRSVFSATGPVHGGELLGLYVERVCSTLEVQLNGQRLYVGGRMTPPVTLNCHYPQLVALPTALLKPEGNQLDIKVVGEPPARVASSTRAGGLSQLQIGPYAQLEAVRDRHLAMNVTLQQAVSAMLVLLGVFMIVMGRLNRRESHLAYFGALSIGWAVINARSWLRDLPMQATTAELLMVALMPFVALAAVQFLLRYAGWRSRPIDVALCVQCATVPLSLWLAGNDRIHTMASSWYVLLLLEIGLAAAFYLWSTWHQRRSRFWPMTLLLGTTLVLVMLELLDHRLLDGRLLFLTHLAMPLAFIMLGMRLTQQYGVALRAAEESRQTLESRVLEATEQIERNFAQLAELRVEQVTERERKRIAADLHDDLGAKLLTIVHTSDSDHISTLAREALEEMRLSVRGLTGKPVKLIDALGDWRAEIVSRVAQTGIEAEWIAPAEELPQTLSARAYVQTTRILREAVNNIIKHSGASRCAVTCRIFEGDFLLAIQDNGRGIPLELDGRLDRGHGMSSMKHRAKQLQGQCLVESGPGYGTVIRLTLPLDRHTAPA